MLVGEDPVVLVDHAPAVQVNVDAVHVVLRELRVAVVEALDEVHDLRQKYGMQNSKFLRYQPHTLYGDRVQLSLAKTAIPLLQFSMIVRKC